MRTSKASAKVFALIAVFIVIVVAAFVHFSFN
jgi:hypothetical protein